MEQALDLGPAHLVGAGGKGVEPAAVHNDRRQLMAITVGKVNGVLQVVEGAPAVLTLRNLHQFRFAATAGVLLTMINHFDLGSLSSVIPLTKKSPRKAKGF